MTFWKGKRAKSLCVNEGCDLEGFQNFAEELNHSPTGPFIEESVCELNLCEDGGVKGLRVIKKRNGEINKNNYILLHNRKIMLMQTF